MDEAPKINIGIIPDGNRRWCKKENCDFGGLVDHWFPHMILRTINDLLRKNAYDAFSHLLRIQSVSVYVSSIENVARTDGSQDLGIDLIRKIYYLCQNLEKFFKAEQIEILHSLIGRTKLNIIGESKYWPEDVKAIFTEAGRKMNGSTYTINLALAYDYEKDLANYGVDSNPSYTRRQAPIDLVFRSGQEKRLSGFFPTKTVYSELFFVDTLWPDVSLKQLNDCIGEYLTRNRRFGH